MNPRIGKLSSGKFYAFLNGYSNEPTYAATSEELEAILAGEVVAAPQVAVKLMAKKSKMYAVVASLTSPSCYNTAYNIEVVASTKVEAVSRARKMVQGLGHTRQDGGLIYTANKI